MSAATTTQPARSRIAELREREARTLAAAHAIGAKIVRLTDARNERIQALNRTRRDLAAAILAQQDTPHTHGC